LDYGDWSLVILWAVLFGIFVAFIPFYKKSQRRPASVYLAFVVALAFEMFGIPLSMYVITWAFGVALPEGFLWGHTLELYIGYWGMYIGFTLNIIGAFLIILGWKEIHKNYWSKEEGKGELVTGGIYAYARHPQYTGFLLMTLGLLVHWATIPLLIMWPILVFMYYRLAKKEEREMEKGFGDKYTEYKRKTSMFVPFLLVKKTFKANQANIRKLNETTDILGEDQVA
jgi:protein-S-isoprenylcysteine O-methyltransferase Ste14